MNNNIKRVGIFGGTLNPIHFGHLLIAEQAFSHFKLDCVLFMPSGKPPHKFDEDILSIDHRENMTKLAICNNANFKYCDMELRREGVIYTSDTLQILFKENPNIEYYFILGADSLFSIESWHKPEIIFQYANIVVAGRPDINKIKFQSIDEIQKQIDYLNHKYNSKVEFLPSPLFDVSSTKIREMVSNNESIKYLVPPAVEQYIYENNLYMNLESRHCSDD